MYTLTSSEDHWDHLLEMVLRLSRWSLCGEAEQFPENSFPVALFQTPPTGYPKVKSWRKT